MGDVETAKKQPAKRYRPRVTSCGALTFRENKEKETFEVLLVQQSIFYDSWSIPKGRIEPDEEHEDCAVREVFEETGTPIKLLKPYAPFIIKHHNEVKILCFWTAEPTEDVTPVANGPKSDVHDVRWFDVKWLPPLSPTQSKIIKRMIDEHIGLYQPERSLEDKFAMKMSERLKLMLELLPTDHPIEWIDLKNELKKTMPASMGKMLSSAHFSTNLQIPNKFEYWLMDQWEQLTGHKPILTKKIHDEEAYQKRRLEAKEKRRAIFALSSRANPQRR